MKNSENMTVRLIKKEAAPFIKLLIKITENDEE